MKRKLDLIIGDDGAAYACLNDVLDNLVDSSRVSKKIHRQVINEPSILKLKQQDEAYVNCDQLGNYIATTLCAKENLDPARCEAVVNELLDEIDEENEETNSQDPVKLMNCLVKLLEAVRYLDSEFAQVVLADIKNHYAYIQSLVNIKNL